jgi:hypothetical protein
MKTLHQNTAIYTREPLHEIELTNVTPERLDVRRRTEYGLSIVDTRIAQFVFDAADLSSQEPPYPVAGDLFQFNGVIYEVASPDESQECFDYITTTRDRIRIYCREIGSV